MTARAARPLRAAAGLATALLLGCLSTLAPDASRAQPPSSGSEPSTERATEFVAVEGPVEEDVPGGPLLLGAYGLALALVLAFVLRLARLQEATGRRLERLERALGERGEPK
ncbi:MAG: hypothetical protein NZ898_13405 [Myxococcota bacterium]|nr:hypothetical protein [Myxococcota bacterium]MDW8363279.1 hypothetical protein [Myxococcales bacterium]